MRVATNAFALEIAGLRKSYDGRRYVLAGVDLQVARGEIVGLLGHNGAGKTTLVSIVAGLRTAGAGSVRVAGVDALRDTDHARGHLGLAPQDLGIYQIVSVRDNLLFFGELNGLGGGRLRRRVAEVADALGLADLLRRPAFELSGGQKRRLHTACALLHRPPLLMLDEPTVGADVETRAALLDTVRQLAAEGSAVVYSTHYLPEIETLGASVAILQGGTIIARGPLDRLIDEYGMSVVELTFDGPAPPLPAELDGRPDGDIVRIKTAAPAAVIAKVLAALGDEDEQRLRAVEILEPSLDSVYLSLTGRRYASDSAPPEAEDVRK